MVTSGALTASARARMPPAGTQPRSGRSAARFRPNALASRKSNFLLCSAFDLEWDSVGGPYNTGWPYLEVADCD